MHSRSGNTTLWVVIAVVTIAAVLGGVYLFAQKEKARRVYERDLQNAHKALELAQETHDEARDIEDPKERRSKERIRDDYLAKARLDFQSARDQRPEDPEPRLGLGQVAYLAGRYNEAVEHFEKVLELGDQSANAYYQLGRSYARWFNEKSQPTLVDKALIHLEEALTIDPEFVEAHKWMAVIYSDPQYGRDDPDKLRRHEDAVLRLAPESDLAQVIQKDRAGQ